MADPSTQDTSRQGWVRRNPAFVLVLVLLLLTNAAWVIAAMKWNSLTGSSRLESVAAATPPPLPPMPVTTRPAETSPVETMEVLVAAKELPAGTVLTASDLPNLVKRKRLPKSSLPAAVIIDESYLREMHLIEFHAAGEVVQPKNISRFGTPILPPNHDLVSFPLPLWGTPGFIEPGSRVDVIATVKRGKKLQAIKVLDGMQILTVDTFRDPETEKANTLNLTVRTSFAVNQDQASLLALAKSRGAHLEVLVRHHSTPIDETFDLAKVKKFFEDWPEPAKGSGLETIPVDQLEWDRDPR